MKIILLFVNVFLWQVLEAQTPITLRGVVHDADGQSVIDAYIYTSDLKAHTFADEFGKFELKGISANDSVIVSYLGFETAHIDVQHLADQEDIVVILVEKRFALEQVYISNSIRSTSQISSIDLLAQPVNSSQEVLRKVPGLFIAQHAGGGKAEQIFLRGFDIDHGTDISISVDGLPVNMVSHAHGQGYADLHFLIPEVIDKIDFSKGPYYSDTGNLNTAGYVAFRTKENLTSDVAAIELGDFNTKRLLAMKSLTKESSRHHAYVAAEYLYSDGPVESPQNFSRLNLLGRVTANLKDDAKLTFLVSTFASQWDASGQIPQRLVDSGEITRYGSVDNTEGGETSRTNVLLEYFRPLTERHFLKSRGYFTKYDFELYSNFTFFLEDPKNGDQIRQKEDRYIVGWESRLVSTPFANASNISTQVGLGFRYDHVKDNELSHTVSRTETISQLRFGDVDEWNGYSFMNLEVDLGDWRINPGVRTDFFRFMYVDRLSPGVHSLSDHAFLISPKLNIVYSPTPTWQLFVKSGTGFHSNDSRVVVSRSSEETLPRALGVDLGASWKPAHNLWLTSALWYLYMQQEFVYVGDAGIVEPSGRSRRFGVDLGMRYQLTPHLYGYGDINYAFVRALDVESGFNYIPLAPDLTASGGLSVSAWKNVSGGFRFRFIKDRPASEDYGITAEGYFVADFNVNYTLGNLSLGLQIENLFNAEWNEAQFATESRLKTEEQAVEELHFTPGVPFYLKGSAQYRF
jgi:hypothetical protein